MSPPGSTPTFYWLKDSENWTQRSSLNIYPLEDVPIYIPDSVNPAKDKASSHTLYTPTMLCYSNETLLI